ncbi:MAG: xanthine dehydrogenase family protein subunit M [Alphaproteobacteria bacterium]|nr:xanthine dehydrogenase family protein subunit M [Alphaproteobacteria bacterium]
MAYFTPTSLLSAVEMLDRGSVHIIAGGTDFYPALGDTTPDMDLLDLTQISELSGITQTATGWRIGAATTWSQLVVTKLPAYFDGLKQTALEIGSLQIQNVATLAGNICNASPAADGMPTLLTLNAEIELSSTSGQRILPLAEFVTGVRKIDLRQDELLSAIIIPKAEESSTSGFLKLGSRRYLVISIAMVAVVIALEDKIISDIRVAVGSCSPVAKRMIDLEKYLIGRDIDVLKQDNSIATELLKDISPIDDLRGTADYRMDSVAELCRRVILTAANCEVNNG